MSDKFTATKYYVRYLLVGIAAFILANTGGLVRGFWGSFMAAVGCVVILDLAQDAAKYREIREREMEKP